MGHLNKLALEVNMGIKHYEELKRAVEFYNMGSDYHTAFIVSSFDKHIEVIFK